MNIFSTSVLTRVIAELTAPAPFILNSFFTALQTETSEEIHFDVANGKKVEGFIDTGSYWYDAKNIDDPKIAAVLYQ